MASQTVAIAGATVERKQNSSVSCSSGVTTNILSITLPSAGVWLLNGYAQINDPSGTSNLLVLSVGESSSDFGSDYFTTTCYCNNKNVPARLSVSGAYVATAAKTLYLNIYQESGSAKAVTYRGFKATRIG